MYNLYKKSETWLVVAFVALALGASPTFTHAQTLVSGNISGTWSPAGNPYVVTDNCIVPSGQVLTIQPGTVVWIGENLSISASGLIQAVGTPAQRITFQAPVSTLYWNAISLTYTSGTNRFKYCDFSNANTALWMHILGGDAIFTVEIMNCNFSNCSSAGIYGEAQGNAYCAWSCWSQFAEIDPIIKNCVFNNTGNGCHFKILGYRTPQYGYIGYGFANPKIMANTFENLSGTAFLMSIGDYAGGGAPTFINNTIINCGVGVDSQVPWDALVQNNIFHSSTNAVRTSGVLSRAISYNCFYENMTNFTGYPSSYGSFIIPNRNGSLCDLSFNLGQDPLFLATNDFHLQTNSPCIDAGTPNWAFTDMCFPPGQGTSYPDLGAYGGPDAANWLDVVPKLPVRATISKSGDVIQINWGAIPRSEYQVQYQTNWPSTNWVNFPNGWVRAIDKPTSLVVATDSGITNHFFRIQSLGRKPGN
jgi:hypothetical protein